MIFSPFFCRRDICQCCRIRGTPGFPGLDSPTALHTEAKHTIVGHPQTLRLVPSNFGQIYIFYFCQVAKFMVLASSFCVEGN